MSADIPYREIVDAEPVILAIVATETVVRNSVTVVTAALLPSAVLRLPATCTITSPCNLLLAYLCWTPPLCSNVVPLLTLLILPRRGLLLLLLPCGVGLLLTLLALLVLLPSGLLLFCCVVLLLTLLALLVLLPLGSLLPFRLGRLLLFGGLSLFLLFVRFVLARVSRSGDSEQQKKRGRSNDSN